MPLRGVPSPCLGCGALTTYGTRCDTCQAEVNRTRERSRQRGNRHYDYAYRKAAKVVRDNAVECWICREGPRDNDPWTADHVYAGQRDSPLMPAHRSCNSRRGNRDLEAPEGGGTDSGVGPILGSTAGPTPI